MIGLPSSPTPLLSHTLLPPPHLSSPTPFLPHTPPLSHLAVPDDKQVSSEMKRSLEGKVPQPDQPVCIEIQMETSEGNALVLEVWSITLDLSKRDISVSVTHLLYPRLSLMLKSLTALSRTTPAYRLSRRQDDELHFTCCDPV